MPSNLKLEVQEVYIPWGVNLPFKGRLYAATPSIRKPKQISAAGWRWELLNLAAQRGKAYLAIPDSFWPDLSEDSEDDGGEPLLKSKLPNHIRILDLCDQLIGDVTALEYLGAIVEHLKDGEDVVILFATKKISGFIPAILSMLATPDWHLEKVFWSNKYSAEYALTPPQRGYLAGLHDANSLQKLGLGLATSGGNDGFDNEVKQPSSALSEVSLGVLEKQIHCTSDQLRSFGSELFHEITGELMDITGFLSECEEHPSADAVVGGMASITYRLCDVFKETCNLGLEALQVIEEQQGGFAPYELESKLTVLRGAHGLIAKRLGRLYDSTLCFIQSDLYVLQGHPEIANDPNLLKMIKLIDDQLDEIFMRLDEIRVAALDINQAVFLEPAPIKQDRDWRAVQAMLADCIQTCLEKAQSERPRWSDEPIKHPKHGESGEVITIKHPTKPSSYDTWHSNRRSAVFVPGGKAPKALNEIAIHTWRDRPRTTEEWNTSDLLLPSLKEPATPKSTLPLASGVVTVEPDGRIWMVSPTNKFGGYETTFPKGKLDHSKLTLQANALKEGYEESGLKVRITGYLGDFKRTTSITRLYLAERVGGDPTEMGWESQAVRLVPKHEWAVHLQNPSDKPVLAALLKHFGEGN